MKATATTAVHVCPTIFCWKRLADDIQVSKSVKLSVADGRSPPVVVL